MRRHPIHPAVLPAILLVLPACTVTREPLPLPAEFFITAAPDDAGADRSHAWIGVEVGLNESEDLMALEVRPGVRVVAVEPEGPGDLAGLQLGDILLTLDGAPVNDPGRLDALLANVETPRRVTLEMERGSRVFATQVEPEIRSAQAGRTLYWIERALLRVAVRNSPPSSADPQGRWPQIAGFGPRSPLEAAGARVGDRVVSFQGADPGSAEAFAHRIGAEVQPGEMLRLELLGPDGERRALEAQAWSPGTALTKLGFWPFFLWQQEADADRGLVWFGDLVLVHVYRVERMGAERKYSILGLITWSTGEALLQDDPVLELGAPAAAPQ